MRLTQSNIVPNVTTSILTKLEDELRAAVKLSDRGCVAILSQIHDLLPLLNSAEIFEAAVRSSSDDTFLYLMKTRSQAVVQADLKLAMECKRGIKVMSVLLFQFSNIKFTAETKLPRDSMSLAVKLEMYDLVRYLLDCHEADEKLMAIERPEEAVESKSPQMIKFLKNSFEQAVAACDLETLNVLMTSSFLQSEVYSALLEAIRLKNSKMISLLTSNASLQKRCLDGEAALLAVELNYKLDFVLRLLNPAKPLSLDNALLTSCKLGQPRLLAFFASFYVAPDLPKDLDRMHFCPHNGLHYSVHPLSAFDVRPIRTPVSFLHDLLAAALNSNNHADLIQVLLQEGSIFFQDVPYGPMMYAFENAIEVTHAKGDIKTRNRVFACALKYYQANPILETCPMNEHCQFLIEALKSAESISVLGHMLPPDLKRSILHGILGELIPSRPDLLMNWN